MNDKYDIPVYSANMYEPFGYIDKSYNMDYSTDTVVWGIDGNWQVNTISSNYIFYPTDHFQVERMLLNTENRKLAEIRTGSNSFHVLLCVDGCGTMLGENVNIPFFKGDCIFVPADSIALKLHGKAQISITAADKDSAVDIEHKIVADIETRL